MSKTRNLSLLAGAAVTLGAFGSAYAVEGQAYTSADEVRAIVANMMADAETRSSMMLQGGGYEVIDLGTDVTADAFIAKAKETGAQVIGISALLTTTMPKQKKLVKTLVESGERENYKVVVGGAPATQRWGDAIGADAYAEDASDGVKKIDGLLGAG